MPIREYICEACGHEFDVIQKMNDKPLKKCLQCRKQKLRKKISAGSFILKGSGWYNSGRS